MAPGSLDENSDRRSLARVQIYYLALFCFMNGNYSPSWHVIARAQPEAISNARMETASPLARSDMGNKVNSYHE
jgi:hypothetical protein